MRFRAGGILFAVEPGDALIDTEREALARLDPPEVAPAGSREEAPGPRADGGADPRDGAFRIRLEDEPPWTSEDPDLFPRWDPAVQRWEDGRLLVSHRAFTAEIRPAEATARLYRGEERAYPLEAVVRTAMMARLPLVGGLPLHAAGVIADGRGLAFFGPSGAGKTTLAGTSPHPVLSDELIALGPGEPPVLVRSGFWGEGGGEDRPARAPLAALVSLGQGPAFSLQRLSTMDAVRELSAAVPVPLAAPLWSRALAVVASTVARVPVYRMEWTPREPPWDQLEEALPTSPRT